MKTEQEIKKMEAQINDMKAEIRKYHETFEAKKILLNEEKFLGKVYRKTDSDFHGTVYVKPISALGHDAPYYMNCLEFILPVSPRVVHGSFYRMCMGEREFAYSIEDDPFMWYETENLKDLEGTVELTEITQEEYNKALDEYFKQLRELPQKYFRLIDVKGEEYVENVKKEDKEMWEETKE